MTKVLSSILLVLFSVQTATAGHVEENNDYSFKCTWLPSDEHAENYFVEDTGFTLKVVNNTHAYILNDNFFFRTYSPCWFSDYSSCAFAYSYDEDTAWTVNDETDTLTQVWRTGFTTEYNDGEPEEVGTVDGVSTLQLDYEGNGTIMISGDDGDGVTFKETFSCKLL